MAVPYRLLCAVALFVAWASTPFSARAFSAAEAYVERPSQGGGGGRWFSGSPADGFGCSVCHSAAPGQRRFPVYVAGLPLKGYTVAEPHEIVLSWPEFAARWTELRPDPMLPPAPDQPAPSVGLVAELVAETGKGSGTIEIRAASASPAEQCEMTRPNLQPRLGVKLYQVRAGVEPLLVKPDSSGVLRCESRQLGQRCIVALTSCGAKQIRFTWTAPSTWEGPIWFSAGFVASEALSGTAEHDSVQEITVPIVRVGTPGATYQETLHNGCALVCAGSRPSTSLLGVAAAVLALLGRRVSRRVRERG